MQYETAANFSSQLFSTLTGNMARCTAATLHTPELRPYSIKQMHWNNNWTCLLGMCLHAQVNFISTGNIYNDFHTLPINSRHTYQPVKILYSVAHAGLVRCALEFLVRVSFGCMSPWYLSMCECVCVCWTQTWAIKNDWTGQDAFLGCILGWTNDHVFDTAVSLPARLANTNKWSVLGDDVTITISATCF